jgi:hypothetical protein
VLFRILPESRVRAAILTDTSWAADVEHQPVLGDIPGVADSEGIDQNVNCAAILASQNLFAIAEGALPLHKSEEFMMPFRGGEDFFAGIAVEKVFAAGMAEHTNKGVVNFYEPSVGTAKEEAFLNIVEQFAVARSASRR